jgi:CxxC motif-containing protein
METSTYLCIGCPLGCRLEVDEDESGQIVEIRGFSCKRGKEYAAQEHSDPRRTVTTTVAIEGAWAARLPVKSSQAIPKARVMAICKALRHVRVSAPVRMGDVIAADILGTGADILATRTMGAAQPMDAEVDKSQSP